MQILKRLVDSQVLPCTCSIKTHKNKLLNMLRESSDLHTNHRVTDSNVVERQNDSF